jgi:predicted nucleotidyltransferase
MAERHIIDSVKRYLQKLIEAGIEIDRAYLYGSYSRGTDVTSDSDIDVMIVSKAFDKTNKKIVGIVWGLTSDIDVRIEPYMVGKQKFENDDVSPLLQIVKKEGILITT